MVVPSECKVVGQCVSSSEKALRMLSLPRVLLSSTAYTWASGVPLSDHEADQKLTKMTPQAASAAKCPNAEFEVCVVSLLDAFHCHTICQCKQLKLNLSELGSLAGRKGKLQCRGNRSWILADQHPSSLGVLEGRTLSQLQWVRKVLVNWLELEWVMKTASKS